MPTTSAVSPGAFVTISVRYLPSPSCVMPRETVTPVLGTSEDVVVLFGCPQLAAGESRPGGDGAAPPGAAPEAAASAQAGQPGLGGRVADEEGAADRGDCESERHLVAVAREDERDRRQHAALADAVGNRVDEGSE